MAVFFDKKCQHPYPGQMTDIQWHKTAPLLAIASVGDDGVGMCNFFTEEVCLLVVTVS